MNVSCQDHLWVHSNLISMIISATQTSFIIIHYKLTYVEILGGLRRTSADFLVSDVSVCFIIISLHSITQNSILLWKAMIKRKDNFLTLKNLMFKTIGLPFNPVSAILAIFIISLFCDIEFASIIEIDRWLNEFHKVYQIYN